MKERERNVENKELVLLGAQIRKLVGTFQFDRCEYLLNDNIGKFPHAAQIHNWYGIVLEEEGRHKEAMRHFRAAWALDPTYIPARYNLDEYCEEKEKKKGAFDESDCSMYDRNPQYEIVYDEQKVGRLIRRKSK